jgi:triosephosphate isomerase
MPLVIANWKMNLSVAGEKALALAYKEKLANLASEVVVCPSFLSLSEVAGVLGGSQLRLGCQDVFWQDSGSYTGEVSPKFLSELGCRYAIIGHSERRLFLGESDEVINKKVLAVLDSGLTPIICIGESSAERRAGQAHNVVLGQLVAALRDVDLVASEQMVISYEPVWAIGTGQVATPAMVGEMLGLIYQTLIDLYPLTIVKNNARLIYGGSVDADNISSFAAIDLCRGFLVGGASLAADEFYKIVSLVKN